MIVSLLIPERRKIKLAQCCSWRAAILVVSVAAGAWWFREFSPTQSPYYPRCFFHHLTGWHCPGCGSLRALHELANGNVLAAIKYNTLLMASLPVALIACVSSYLKWRSSLSGPWRLIWIARWDFWVLGMLFTFGILRNLPFAPFNWLAPGTN